jgi:hypothetical protein
MLEAETDSTRHGIRIIMIPANLAVVTNGCPDSWCPLDEIRHEVASLCRELDTNFETHTRLCPIQVNEGLDVWPRPVLGERVRAGAAF